MPGSIPGSLLNRTPLGAAIGAAGSGLRRSGPGSRCPCGRATKREPCERVDVESPHDRGVEALEIEGEHVPGKTGPGRDDAAARRAVEDILVDAESRGDDAPQVQVLGVEELERRHAHRGLLQRRADEEGLAHGDVEQSFLQQYLQGEPRVLQAVRAEAVRLFPVQSLHGRGPALPGQLVDPLSPSQDALRGGLQPVVLQSHAGDPHEPHRVQHLSAGNDRLAPAPPGDAVAVLAVQEARR